MGLYEDIGGRDTCYQLSAAFYGRVAQDPLLRPLFPGKSHRCAIEMFAADLLRAADAGFADEEDGDIGLFRDLDGVGDRFVLGGFGGGGKDR